MAVSASMLSLSQTNSRDLQADFVTSIAFRLADLSTPLASDTDATAEAKQRQRRFREGFAAYTAPPLLGRRPVQSPAMASHCIIPIKLLTAHPCISEVLLNSIQRQQLLWLLSLSYTIKFE